MPLVGHACSVTGSGIAQLLHSFPACVAQRLRFVPAPPILVDTPQLPVCEATIGPVLRPLGPPMLDRIVVDVVQMLGEILLIPDHVIPVALLPKLHGTSASD